MTVPMRFADVRQGDRGRVVAIRTDSIACERIQEMGLVVGTEFTVCKVAPLGDPIELCFRGQHLVLRRHEFDTSIDVEPIE